MAYKGEEDDKSRSKLLALLGFYPNLLALRLKLDLHCTGLLHKRSHVLLPGNDVIDLPKRPRRCKKKTEDACFRVRGVACNLLRMSTLLWLDLYCHAMRSTVTTHRCRTHVPKARACYMSMIHRNQHRHNARDRQRCARLTGSQSVVYLASLAKT